MQKIDDYCMLTLRSVNLGAVRNSGSGWENQDRWNARDKPIRFKDLEFETAERLEKKMKNILSQQQKLFHTMQC